MGDIITILVPGGQRAPRNDSIPSNLRDHRNIRLAHSRMQLRTPLPRLALQLLAIRSKACFTRVGTLFN